MLARLWWWWIWLKVQRISQTWRVTGCVVKFEGLSGASAWEICGCRCVYGGGEVRGRSPCQKEMFGRPPYGHLGGYKIRGGCTHQGSHGRRNKNGQRYPAPVTMITRLHPPKERKPLPTNKLGRGGSIPKIAAIDSWYWCSLFLAFDPATVSTSDTMDTAVWLHRPNMITLLGCCPQYEETCAAFRSTNTERNSRLG